MTLTIVPNEYYDQENGGTIPIFKPTLEEFKDFKVFMESIEEYGKKAGIIKIIPPKEWKSNLPELKQSTLDQLKVTKPITQHILGGRGVYTQTNIENRKEFSLNDWYQTCHLLDNRPPQITTARKSPSKNIVRARRDITANKDKFYYVRDQKMSLNSDQSHLSVDQYKEIERNYWRNITFNQPMYGADMLGTLFDDSVKSWNPNTLDNTLNKLNVTLPGVNSPYLYFGMWKATFAWHVEDMDLYSINYIHFGAPKQWYIIQPCYQKRFENFMQATFYMQYKSCHEFLRHKTFIVSPKVLENNNIPVQRCVQQPGEFIVTYPFGYHSGYNLDFNCAESVNFAMDTWLEIGKKAKSCACTDDSVVIDVNSLLESSNETKQDQFPLVKDVSEYDHGRNTRKKRKINRKQSKKSSVHGNESTACVLCSSPQSSSKEPLLKSACGEYNNIHRVCAEAVDETYIIRNQVWGIDRVPMPRWRLVCVFCKEKTGACMQCCYGKCWRAFHATCAIKNNATMDRLPKKEESIPHSLYNGYCPQHDPKRHSEKQALQATYIKEMVRKFKVDRAVYAKWRGGGFYSGIIKECLPQQKMCRVLSQDGVTRKVSWRDLSFDEPTA